MGSVKPNEETPVKPNKPIEFAKHILIPAAVMILLVLLVYFLQIPNPNMILITGLAVFASLYGYDAGIVCGLIMIVYSMFFFSTDHSFSRYTQVNLIKLVIIVIGVILNIAFIGHLKNRERTARRQIMDINRMLKEDNLTLEAATIYDSLTRVKNRFALRRDYDSYADTSELNVVMLDIDNFKVVNDSFGHSVGDYLLKRVGDNLIDIFGNQNSYRYDGDEFLIIVGRMNDEEFQHNLGVLQDRLSDISLDDKSIPVCFSAGYVYGRSSIQDDLRLMIRQADDILYKAKSSGKNVFLTEAYNRDHAIRLKKRTEEAFRKA